jgi:hypothetical protein
VLRINIGYPIRRLADYIIEHREIGLHEIYRVAYPATEEALAAKMARRYVSLILRTRVYLERTGVGKLERVSRTATKWILK